MSLEGDKHDSTHGDYNSFIWKIVIWSILLFSYTKINLQRLWMTLKSWSEKLLSTKDDYIFS